MAYRKILHLDLDAFFCSVEENQNPALRGTAFAVGGRPEERGVVASCSYPARKMGVRSAMPMIKAQRLCPHLIIVPSRHSLYREASEQVMAILHEFTPLVEQISIDEAFLDVSNQTEEADVMGRRLQQRINTELNLPCSLGVATNKLVAKIANNIGKARSTGHAPPNAISIILPGDEAEFLAPLPVGELWGVGPKTEEALAKLDILTIGDLALWDEADLTRRFGKHGTDLARHARGLDDRPIETEHEIKSVSRETTFVDDILELDVLKTTLYELAEDVEKALKKHDLKGYTIKIKLRWSDFTTLTRQTTLDHRTQSAVEIYRVASDLLERHWQQRAVRLIGVGVSSFEEHASEVQLRLWDALM